MSRCTFYSVADFRGPDCIGYLVSQTQSAMRPQVEALFEHEDISFSQWRVLMCLRDGLASTCADISRELSHDKGSMTRLIDQLEARDFLERKRNGGDRRLVALAMTASGRAAVERLIPKVVDYYNDLLEGFSPADVRRLVDLLKRLRKAVKSRDVAMREMASAS